MAEEETSKIKLRKITSSLQKIVECPICLDTIKPPFRVCGRGHGVCKPCCGRLRKCPMCQDVFIGEDLVCLKNLLEALPRLCRNSEDGCEEVVEQGSDHEEFCGYRPTACRQLSCKVKVPLVKLMDHYKTVHPKRFICKEKSQSLEWAKFDCKMLRNDHIPVLVFNNIFWLSPYSDDKGKHLKFSFRATPIGKLKTDYFAKVKFENGDFEYTYTIKASVLHSRDDCEHYNDARDDKTVEEEEYCMKVPQGILSEFINNEGKLAWTVYFLEQKVISPCETFREYGNCSLK